MKQYPKINAPFKRDRQGKFLPEFATPEIEYLKDNTWEFSEKFDGCNLRIRLVRFDDCVLATYEGRTDKAQIPVPLLLHLEKVFPTIATHRRDLNEPSYRIRNAEILEWMNHSDLESVVLYGEGIGPGIQNGGKYCESPTFVLFDVMVGDFFLQSADVTDVADKLNIPRVPIVGHGTLMDGIGIVLGENSDCQPLQSAWGNFTAEGVVAKPLVQLFDRKGNPVWTKIKFKDFYNAALDIENLL